MANELLLKAESNALIGKIYYMYVKNFEKANIYYKEFLKDAGVLYGTEKNPIDQAWYAEAKDLE